MKKHVHIIGGGIGGLFTAALLAKEGYPVTVLERSAHVGGGLQSFTRHGVSFDAGMHVVGGLQPGGSLHRICRHLGILDQLHYRLVDADCGDEVFCFEDGKTYRVPQGRTAFTAPARVYRIIIFSTDNDLAGEELITLPDAGKICEEKNIIVYGIGTEYMYSGDLKEMKKTVENTGGEFFYGESNTAVRDIVSAIEDQVETLDDATYEITEVDQPEMPFYLLLTTIAAMILLAFVTKV